MISNQNMKIIPCKIIILGESNSGKSSIIKRFLSNNFDYNKYKVSGACGFQKSIYLKNCNKQINFEIWDTPGQKKYRILHKVLYENTNVFILVYDITNRNSFEEIRNYWINEIKIHSLNNSSILIFFLIL